MEKRGGGKTLAIGTLAHLAGKEWREGHGGGNAILLMNSAHGGGRKNQ